jgi:hypothetical protein
MSDIMETLLIVLAVAGLTLLWRTYRYDSDIGFNAALNRLPYFLQKPITCGICLTFWASLVAVLIFYPFPELITVLPYRFALGPAAVNNFFVQWFALGTLASAVVYFIDTLFHVSHYFRHAADTHAGHE